MVSKLLHSDRYDKAYNLFPSSANESIAAIIPMYKINVFALWKKTVSANHQVEIYQINIWYIRIPVVENLRDFLTRLFAMSHLAQ